jgi:UDP-N-acetylmuramyl tripeptide synthase
MKLRLIILLGQFAGWLSRITKRGSGIMVAGRVILKLDGDAVATMAKHRQVILISGTNGKTTTTSLVRKAIETRSKVACNSTGANLFAGVAEALSANLSAPIAVLEVDEMVIPWAVAQTKPEMVVLLNLGRDQLDRLSEVRVVAQKWKTAVQKVPRNCRVFADADDPFVVWAAQDCENVVWFSAGAIGHLDASTCPVCGEVLVWSKDASSFSCSCGFSKPNADWTLGVDGLHGPENIFVSISSAIPGVAARSNAGRAVAVAVMMGVKAEDATRAVGDVASIDGRFGKLRIGKTNFRLMLSKNPASWRETLTTSAIGSKKVLLVVNALTQDGKDTSWLWDVDFAPLSGREVIVTGDRRLDVSARLTVEGVAHEVVADENAAAKIFGASEADIIASYTAFHRLAKLVAKT